MKTIFHNHTLTKYKEREISVLAVKVVRTVLALLPRSKALRLRSKRELIIVFVKDSQMKRVNMTFRNKNSVTDILSFESDDKLCLGELLLAPNFVRKQAARNKLGFRSELTYLLIHGVLHLLGYDHENSPSEARRMFEIQDTAFDLLSVPTASC